MKKAKYISHHIPLMVILGFGVLALLASSSKKLQTEILILIAVFYVFWGIIHHHQNHSLNSKIVLEYILIAALGIAALLFFIMGAFGL